jgi:hypothetical protein
VNPTVSLVQVDPSGPTVVAALGDGPPTLSGEGGWEVVKRPKWVGFTNWEGIDPYTLDIPLLFDGFARDVSVERDLGLMQMMMRPAVTPSTRPPIIRAVGPVPMTHLRWVITNIEWGDCVRRADGARTRQFVTLHLLQFIPPDVMVAGTSSPAEAAQVRATSSGGVTSATTPAPATPAPSAATYTVRSGDTLSAIAARVLGNANRWQEIANLNSIRDPRALRVGQVLRLP